MQYKTTTEILACTPASKDRSPGDPAFARMTSIYDYLVYEGTQRLFVLIRKGDL